MKRLILVFITLIMTASAACAQKQSVPSIPAGDFSAQLIDFDGKRMLPVYSAPDDDSLRGASGRAKVSTNDWIQVFGIDGNFAMVQYGTREDRLRIGYILRNKLPDDASVPTLHFGNSTAVLNTDTVVTDDPLVSREELTTLSSGTQVTHLGDMGNWSYIEAVQGSKRLRGFISADSFLEVVTSAFEAQRALAGTWQFHAGSLLTASSITLRENGDLNVTEQDGSQWSGTWTVYTCDAENNIYWNQPEFELHMNGSNSSQRYGLRICRQEGGYALILSDCQNDCNMVRR